EIKYVETDNTGDDNYDGLHQVRACLRGRSMRRRVYNPDRLKYPMKRVGARGEGKFERISWEEAFSRIAKLMKADRDANFIEKNEQGVTVNRWLSTGM
ncbi:molybdopterin-dependent oxidoreductase, partial [Haemophilus seminalis]|uniref:molybdopterin-dependent oxidoreductase n=1 Tax=Haemophilus seminalis TaxID=2582921 RepID=UPI002557A607